MYTPISIPKKNGGTRKLLIPNEELKKKQREILKTLYTEFKDSEYLKYSYGFIPHKNIYENAKMHCGKKFIINIDIKDFFDNCHEKHAPHSIRDIKKYIFYDDRLPQGAPTSPFIANLIIGKVDHIIHSLLRTYISTDIIYTRYADDITISSNSKAIFSNACINIVSSVLSTIELKINPNKIRKLTPSKRKEVTGLCINSGQPTISRQKRRRLKAMIYNAIKAGTIKREEYNKINGYLSFLLSIPAHRNFAIQQKNKLKTIRIVD